MSKQQDIVIGDLLTKLRKDVVADKMLEKMEMTYVVEKKRKLLSFRKRHNQVIVSGDKNRVNAFKAYPDAEEWIKGLFEGDDDDQEEKEYALGENITIPRLFCAFKNKALGWTWKNVEKYSTLCLNILGFGKGSQSLGKKDASSEIPPWWSKHVNFKKFTSASKASMEENEDIIQSIFDYFKLDIKTWVFGLNGEGAEEELEQEVQTEVGQEVVSVDQEEVPVDQEEVSVDQEVVSVDQKEVSVDQEVVSVDQQEVSVDQEMVPVELVPAEIVPLELVPVEGVSVEQEVPPTKPTKVSRKNIPKEVSKKGKKRSNFMVDSSSDDDVSENVKSVVNQQIKQQKAVTYLDIQKQNKKELAEKFKEAGLGVLSAAVGLPPKRTRTRTRKK